jgi:hypothetical protein
MTEVLRIAASRNGPLALGNETLASRLTGGAGAGTGSFAGGSGAMLVARTIISATAALLIQIRMVDACIFQSDGGNHTPGVKWLVARARPVVLAWKLRLGCALSLGVRRPGGRGYALNEP